MSRLNFFGLFKFSDFFIFFPSSLLPPSPRMGAMDANMVELAERIPVFAEAQVLPRSTANLSELRMYVPPARTALFSDYIMHALHYALNNVVRHMHYSAHNVVSHPIRSLKRLAWIEPFPYSLAFSQPFPHILACASS